jgi:lactoylglutathione lyase
MCRSGGRDSLRFAATGLGDEVVAPRGISGKMCAAEFERCRMNQDDFPAPTAGFVLTHFLVVADQDRSREFYRSLFDGQVLVERDPVIMKVANSWLILNVGGGPTDDKPTVTLTTPTDPNRTSAFLNVRVADIARVYQEWSAKGAEFLTEPKDHGREIRAYIRDPDGHLIEVGQSTGILR